MDPQEKQMLEKLLEMTEQNGKILRGLHRQMVLSKVFTILYWAVIIGLAIWSFNMIQPYLGMMTGLAGKAQQIQGINIQNLLE